MKIALQQLRDLSEGVIQKVDTAIRPANSVYLGVNVFFDMVFGRAVLRDGTTQLGAQVMDNKSCLGLFTHITTAGTIVPLAVFNAADGNTSVVSKYTSSAWSNAKTGLTKDLKMRFATYLDTTVGINGTDKISSVDGATWVTTAGKLDVGNMPTGKYVQEFLDKVQVAGNAMYPDRLYQSQAPLDGEVKWTLQRVRQEGAIGLVDGTNKDYKTSKVFNAGTLKVYKNNVLLTVTTDYTVDGTNTGFTMVATPTVGSIILVDYDVTITADYIDIEPEEGAGPITALSKVPGYTLIFKERSMKRWDGQSTYPESMMNIGALSQEAVVRARQSVIFYNPKRGPFETTGSMPRFIGRRIQAIIDAVPSSYYSQISGGSDGNRVYFSIGDITLDDLNLTNCVLAYSLDYQHWTLLSFPNEFKAFATRVDSNKDEILFAGDDDGNVWDLFVGTGDGASNAPFNWTVQWEQLEFGTRGRYKDIPRMVVYTKDVRNGKVSVRSDESEEFSPHGTISKSAQEIVKSMRGRYFDIRLQGRGTSGQVIGIDFPEPDIYENYS